MNEAIAMNKELKCDIDAYRKDKGIYEALLKEL